MLLQLKAIFTGNVQGVFFRSRTKKYADQLGLKGYAKNLENGSVEVCAIGEKKLLEEFLEKIKKEPGFGTIETVKHSFSKNLEIFVDFKTY